MNKTEATAMAHSIAEQELLPFLRSLESQMITDEVFLSFCQTTILTITKVMSDFCVGYKDFEHKEIWLEGVKDKIHQGVDKFFNAGNENSDLTVTSKTFFQ